MERFRLPDFKKGSVGRWRVFTVKACLVVSGFFVFCFFTKGPHRRREIFPWWSSTVGPCLIRWEIHPLLRRRCHPWEEMAVDDDVLDARGFIFSLIYVYTCVCECLIMTEKRRGNASLPLMSVVNPPPSCLTEAASARIRDRENGRKSRIPRRAARPFLV